jgi:hypothetical protein
MSVKFLKTEDDASFLNTFYYPLHELFTMTVGGFLWLSDYVSSPYSVLEAIVLRHAYSAAVKFFGKFCIPSAYLFNVTADLTRSSKIVKFFKMKLFFTKYICTLNKNFNSLISKIYHLNISNIYFTSDL